MAYLSPLDPLTPPGTEAVGQGDDRMREMKAAIIERLASFFVGVDDDPLVPKPNSIPTSVFADNTLSGSKLIDGSIALAKLATIPFPGTGTITAIELADGSVTNPKLAADAVDGTKIADNSVNTEHIVAASIKRSHLYLGLRSDLVRWQSYTLVLGSTVLAAGLVARGSINMDTNDQLGGAVACIIEPAFTFADASGATHVTDYVLAQCSITLNGSQEVLVYRLHNLLGSSIDLTGQVYYIHMLQRLSTAPAEV